MLKQTFCERRQLSIFATISIIGIVLVGVFVTSEWFYTLTGNDPLAALAVLMLPAFVWVLMATYTGVREYKRDLNVNLFTGEIDIVTMARSSLEYLGYKVKLLKSNCIIVNDDHLVFACNGGLNLKNIDETCRLAKERDIKKISIILASFDLNGVSSGAKKVAKRHGITIYKKPQLLDVMNRAIKHKGGDPIRECVC